MKNSLLMFAMVLMGAQAWALPDKMICKTSTGSVQFTFEPFTASTVNADGTATPFLHYGNICNQDVSKMNPKPTCRVKDQTADHYLIQTLECQADGQWFADAFVEISQITKDGRFQCKTKFGAHQDITINFSNCTH